MTDAGIDAFCYQRQAGRTFLASRISRCVDLNTGEIVADIPLFLRSAYEKTPYGRLNELRKEFSDEISALFYVSKVDGRSTKAEKDLIADFLLKVCNIHGLKVDDIVNDLKSETQISKAQFQRCIGRLSRKPDLDKKGFLIACRNMIGLRKNIPESSRELIEYLEKKLGAS